MSESRNDRIREAVNIIESAEGARDRMLANIKRKAAEQAAGEDIYSTPALEKNIPFKRFVKWLIPIAACFVIVVIGTAERQKTNNTTDPLSATTNPFAGVDNTVEPEPVYAEIIPRSVEECVNDINSEQTTSDQSVSETLQEKLAELIKDKEAEITIVDKENVRTEFLDISEIISLAGKTEMIQFIDLLNSSPEEISEYIVDHNGNAFGLSIVPTLEQCKRCIEYFKNFLYPNNEEWKTWGLVCREYFEELTFGFSASDDSMFWVTIMPFVENSEVFLQERAKKNGFNLEAIENERTEELYYAGVKESFSKAFYYYYGIENGTFFYVTTTAQNTEYRDNILRTITFDTWTETFGE